MAVPQRRTSRSKRDSRRAHNSKIAVPALSECTNCNALIVPHRVCPQCGYYKGVPVIEVDNY